ncbi:hypothetical protein ACH33_09435 [Aneurinibacillus sp. XH2]|nr:hypothetical protein ACH33_09435 [Aneurinibacillus sp. XH2]
MIKVKFAFSFQQNRLKNGKNMGYLQHWTTWMFWVFCLKNGFASERILSVYSKKSGRKIA